MIHSRQCFFARFENFWTTCVKSVITTGHDWVSLVDQFLEYKERDTIKIEI